MHKIIKQSTIFFVIAALVIIPCGSISLAQDENQNVEISAEKMIFDFILLRPLGIVGTVLGTAMFIVSLPFSAAGGNSKEAYQKMMVEPASYTFKRPLGDF
jgi:ABC-type Fe3+ transport system permease subunit